MWFAEEKMTPPLTALIKGMSRVPDMVVSSSTVHTTHDCTPALCSTRLARSVSKCLAKGAVSCERFSCV